MPSKPRTADEWRKIIDEMEKAESLEESEEVTKISKDTGVRVQALVSAEVSKGVNDGKGSNTTATTGAGDSNMVPLHILAACSSPSPPCVDCSSRTGNFCDGFDDDCFAELNLPDGDWGYGQRTPFCTPCEDKKMRCKFCRRDPRHPHTPPWKPPSLRL